MDELAEKYERRRQLLRLPLALVVIAVVGLTIMALAPEAPRSAPNDDVVRSLDVAITVEQSGTLHITESYAWDFGYR